MLKHDALNFDATTWTLVDCETDFCTMVNKGVESCDTEYFSILEFDDRFTPNAFNSFIPYIEVNEPDTKVFLSIQELYEAHDKGILKEAFGTGTAAVISPVGKIVDHGKEICFPSGMQEMGPISKKLYDTLTGIQSGKIEAPEGWIKVIA
jgi:hypothetical protein